MDLYPRRIDEKSQERSEPFEPTGWIKSKRSLLRLPNRSEKIRPKEPPSEAATNPAPADW